MKAATVALAALTVGFTGWAAYNGYRATQATIGLIRAQDAKIDSLRAITAQRDTVYHATVDTLRVVRVRTDSVFRRDTLRFTDTLVHVDTVRQLVERERLACDAVILSCEARVAARDSIIAVQAEVIAAERSRDRLPLFRVKLPGRGASLGLGFAAGLGAALLLGHR